MAYFFLLTYTFFFFYTDIPMTNHISIYLDESGDLGFDLTKSNTSKYFVVTVLVCENRQIIKTVRHAISRTLKNKLTKKSTRRIHELKGTSTKLSIKKYFYNQLPENGWSLYSVILNKHKVQPHLKTRTGKKKLYNFIAGFLLKEIKFPDSLKTVNLVVDKCKNTEEVKDFNSYLESQLQAILHLDTRLDINHELSHENAELQAVDLFCWGIARKHSSNDLAWYNVYKHKIEFETVYLK